MKPEIRSAASVFALCLLVFLVNGRPHPEVDCVAAPYTAWSLVRHGSYDLRAYPELSRYFGGQIRARPDGAMVSIRTPGSAFFAVPLVAPLALFRDQPLRDREMDHLGKLAAAISVAGAAVFFFLICRRIAPSAAWPATILFAFGTCLYSVASQALWMHGPTAFWLCCALYLLVRGEDHSVRIQLAAGLALGLAVLSRPNAAFFAIATVLALLARRRWRAVFFLSLGGVLPALILFHYNWVNFGHLVLGGYENEDWAAVPPLWWGLSGLLVAPSRGLLVYTPALVLALPGAWRLMRKPTPPMSSARGLLFAWLAAAGVTILFFARWVDWRGGWCYGPRLLTETLPILCLFFAIAYDGFRKGWPRYAAIALVSVSVGVHAVGVFGYSGYEAWQRRHPFTDGGRSLFRLHDTQIEAHARAFLRKLSGRKRT